MDFLVHSFSHNVGDFRKQKATTKNNILNLCHMLPLEKATLLGKKGSSPLSRLWRLGLWRLKISPSIVHVLLGFHFFPLCFSFSKSPIQVGAIASGYAISREGNGSPLQYSCLGKSHGQRSLVGCSPRGRSESDTTERLHSHLSLSCIGEGNGNPLQCSCLENPRDRGAWWAAICGVAQSRTRLKRLSSSSSMQYLL